MKFRLLLEEYNFTIKYKKRQNNIIADALSKIDITIEDLKSLTKQTKSTVNVLIKAQTKYNRQNENKKSQDNLSHIGSALVVLDLFHKLKDRVELKLLEQNAFQKLM
ncbi:MAG: hypothetical protein GAK29_04700 [Acinetobacter bereziniae]|uniref:Uncharacterized protein n=1 Tax=Acinetobacter bereziniae TaxID=106648 RepID=A0A833UIL9_ACIBZ|nr:MAG: hypothetical protein GAK29_04700 [Acinetobacter bereziniae]